MTPIVRLLLISTVGAYLLQKQLPQAANYLVFFPPITLRQPWSLLTYMFLHGSGTHLLFNMIALFFFGPRVEVRLGSRSFAFLYFLSGLSGALLSAVFSWSSPIIGASAGVFGVMLAFAYFWPRELIYIWGIIPVPSRVLVIATTALALWSGFSNTGSGIAHFAHLGGYLGAYLYLKWVSRKKRTFRAKHEAAPPVKKADVLQWQQVDRSGLHPLNSEELDRILDKIRERGIESLKPSERMFLSNFVPGSGTQKKDSDKPH